MLTWAMVFLLTLRKDIRISTGILLILIACDTFMVLSLISAIR